MLYCKKFKMNYFHQIHPLFHLILIEILIINKLMLMLTIILIAKINKIKHSNKYKKNLTNKQTDMNKC